MAYGLRGADALSVYGVLTGMSLPLILFPSAVTNSISVLLLPIVSEADASGNQTAVRRAIFTSIRCCLLLGFFCTTLFLVFGRLAGRLLFHSELAGSFILTLSFLCPFMYIASMLNSILNGLGKTIRTFLFQRAKPSFAAAVCVLRHSALRHTGLSLGYARKSDAADAVVHHICAARLTSNAQVISLCGQILSPTTGSTPGRKFFLYIYLRFST